MNSYIETNLLDGEKIIAKSHRHWIVFTPTIFWFIISLAFYVQSPSIRQLALFPILIGIVQGLFSGLDYFLTEIALTNMRIVVRVGFVAQSSFEIINQNISSIDVNQSLWGKIFNYGNILVNDIGGRTMPAERIAQPLAFRRAIQKQIALFTKNK